MRRLGSVLSSEEISPKRTTQRMVPISGETAEVVINGDAILLLDPATPLATLTIQLPAEPTDNDTVTIGSSQAVTAVTMTNGRVLGPLTGLVAGGFAKYIYNQASDRWFRIG